MPKLSRKSIPIENQYSADAEFYLATKTAKKYFSDQFFKSTQQWTLRRYLNKVRQSSVKTYPLAEKIKIKPDFSAFRKLDFEKLMLKRKSERSFKGKSITFRQLSTLLQLTVGTKKDLEWLNRMPVDDEWPQRSLPSAGAIFPLEVYIINFNIRGLEPGVYHFSPFENSLSFLRPQLKEDELKFAWAQRDLMGQPSCMILITSVFKRNRIKYISRGLRFIFMEVGVIGCALNLFSGILNIGFCFDGAGFDHELEHILGVDGYNEGIVGCFVLGRGQKT